ncbi:MAG: DUF4406 domain-containing protein, partial [Bacteroidales bacterium]
GKISDLPTSLVKAKFELCAKELRKEGHKVLIPTDIEKPNDNFLRLTALERKTDIKEEEWHYYMNECWALIAQCTHIYMLKGWEFSRGARLEKGVAEAFGKGVMFE